MRTLSSVALASAHAQETDEVWLLLLRIKHPDITGEQLLVNPDFSGGEYGWTVTVPGFVDTAGVLQTTNASGVAARQDVTIGTQVLDYQARVVVDALGDGAPVFTAGTTANATAYKSEPLELGLNIINFSSLGADPVLRVGISKSASTVRASISSLSVRPLDHIRLVNNNENITGGSDNREYVAFPFMFDLPTEDPEQPQVGRLKIDNVDTRVVETVRGLTSPAKADIELVLASQTTTVEIDFLDMTLRAVDYDALEVSGTLTLEEIFTEPVSLEMTPSRFPGLF